MTDRVRIIEGEYKKGGVPVDVNGMVFTMTKGYVLGSRGGYITVDSTEHAGFPDRNIRIMVESEECFQYVDGDEPVQQSEQTDDEIIDGMRRRFKMLEALTEATKGGNIRALIVSGPPGVGKSYGVEKVLAPHELLADLGGKSFEKCTVVKGNMSPLGLYVTLFNYSDRDNIIVFDDCDSIFDDPLSLNILKAALDSKDKRTIHWNTDSRKLKDEGIPNSFTFRGGVIFITNVKFANVRSKKLRDHIEALESRCHYIDLSIDTDRHKMLRIKQVVRDGMLDTYGFDDGEIEELIEFIDGNRSRVRELSLRTMIKTADLMKAFPAQWEDMAEATLMKLGR